MSPLLVITALLIAAPADAGMAEHLEEAIALNTARKARYATLTDGRSDALFDRLIWNERALLPVAWVMDAQAAPFNAQGIGVVRDDFISMERVAPFGTPIPPTMPMSDDAAEHARAVLWQVYLDSGAGLQATVQACAEGLEELSLIEREAELSFVMSRHLIESLGYSALHGLEHNEASGGETEGLVAWLVGLQRLGLVTLDPVGIDRQANAFHVDGIGIIANDVPPIPFEDELAAGR